MTIEKAFLVLEDGSVFDGVLQSDVKTIEEKAGEVVFNTAHAGYEEIATDPSYFSQIMVMTAPMQGNYGAHSEVWESDRLWIQGFVCVQMQNTPREKSWLNRLNEHRVPVLSEVDTRRLVLQLRSQGTPWGAIVRADSENMAREKALELIKSQKNIDKDWAYLCSRKQIQDQKGENPKGPRVAVLDFGCKENIIRELRQRCSQIRIFPSRTEARVIAEWSPNALMLTNGPGDPADVQKAPETVKKFIGKIPVFGICMGHQILSLALGAKTYRMKFGHRGANHPIKDDLLQKIYMSSQNHGYAVDEATLPKDVKVMQRNLNDQTVAGIYSETLNCLGIQYHPESHPGPHEAVGLFDFFVNTMNQSNKMEQNNYDL